MHRVASCAAAYRPSRQGSAYGQTVEGAKEGKTVEKTRSEKYATNRVRRVTDESNLTPLGADFRAT